FDNNNLDIQKDSIDSSKYYLTLSPKENMYGNSSITVIVSDDGGTVDGGIDHIEVYFNVVVSSVNDSPNPVVQIGELVVSSNNYLYENVNGLNRFLSVNIENLSDSLRFEWTESVDVDGD
ncbi:MAG: hypothetical protein VW963_08485, partial [Candidatus Neomarinimicrobiota bacterium]